MSPSSLDPLPRGKHHIQEGGVRQVCPSPNALHLYVLPVSITVAIMEAIPQSLFTGYSFNSWGKGWPGRNEQVQQGMPFRLEELGSWALWLPQGIWLQGLWLVLLGTLLPSPWPDSRLPLPQCYFCPFFYSGLFFDPQSQPLWLAALSPSSLGLLLGLSLAPLLLVQTAASHSFCCSLSGLLFLCLPSLPQLLLEPPDSAGFTISQFVAPASHQHSLMASWCPAVTSFLGAGQTAGTIPCQPCSNVDHQHTSHSLNRKIGQSSCIKGAVLLPGRKNRKKGTVPDKWGQLESLTLLIFTTPKVLFFPALWFTDFISLEDHMAFFAHWRPAR